MVALLMLAATVAARLNPDPGFRSTPLPDRPTTYPDGHYAFLMTQPGNPEQPVGYDPCREVRVLVDFDGAPDGFSRMVKDTLHDLDQVSGLRLRYAGATRGVPDGADGTVVVRFASATTEPDLAHAAGRGGSVPTVGANGMEYYRWGRVRLNDRFGSYGERAGLTILHHEFGHVVGLDHVASGDEIMFPGNYGRASYAHGDLTGLALLGRLPCA